MSPAELISRLQAITAPKFTWRDLFKSRPAKLFRGEIDNESFAIRRIINYKNSMLPQIAGHIALDSSGVGSLLRLEHKQSTSTIIFAVIWLGFVAVQLWNAIADSINYNYINSSLAPLTGMFVFGFAFFTIPFWLEVRKSRTLLMELLVLRKETVD
ncbi:hypothetical protein [Hymenobacter negativus]|uniref:Uncharacterized protein n=1 Tax=Hymenobacter negativus TaxID=2795026 RepID=A0ABS0Q5D2_9BACT|nr:hypothetical protein [Hymenobacter negativus]MBH8557871.1 hypothetical protein [Hymenobacter negativus]